MVRDPDYGVVWDALRRVYDPELGIDIVSLGLVYDVREENGQVVIEMTLTTPGCPVSDGLPEQVEAEVGSALGPNVIDPDVRLVWDPPLDPGPARRGSGSRSRVPSSPKLALGKTSVRQPSAR